VNEIKQEFRDNFPQGTEYVEHKSEDTIRLKDGGLIRFGHIKKRSEKKSNMSGIANASYDVRYIFVFVDEAYEMTMKMKSQIEIRLRGKNPNLQMIWIFASNPYVRGNQYVDYLGSLQQ
jgi:lipocalin